MREIVHILVMILHFVSYDMIDYVDYVVCKGALKDEAITCHTVSFFLW